MKTLSEGNLKSQTLIGVYGASGYGREVLPLVRDSLASFPDNTRLVFIDDNSEASQINSCKVLTYENFISDPAPLKFVTIAIANSQIRQNLLTKLNEEGIQILNVKAPNVVVMDEVAIGAGSILSPFVTLTSNINIGIGFHANIYSYVGHDCVIGNFVTFAPAVKCNGNIEIADHVYIGTGAILKQGRPGHPLKIGAGAVIGMGAVVTKSVPEGETVIGNPARPLSKDSLRKQS